MDVSLIATSALALPSSERVDAIVYGGAADLRVWPGPGPDRDLTQSYGDELSRVLSRERERLDGGRLEPGQMLRLHRGRLHCDFLLWIATREAEEAGRQGKAHGADLLRSAVRDALAFASLRHVARIAFSPLGAGPGELDDVERIVLIARAASAYYDECYAAGQPTGVEEVLVCHKFNSKISDARRELGGDIAVVAPPVAAKAEESDKKKRRVTRAASSGAAPRKRAVKKLPPRLSDEEVGAARASAGPYDRARTYEVGDFMVHSKFGVGRIEEITAEGFIMVLFSSGETKRLLHARP